MRESAPSVRRGCAQTLNRATLEHFPNPVSVALPPVQKDQKPRTIEILPTPRPVSAEEQVPRS
jgi:hypothetical protein